MIKKTDVQNLAKSFRYAFRGIAYCIKNERNMRIHLCAVVLVSYFSWFFGLRQAEYLALFFCFGLVVVSEVFNTAIEALVNLESPSYHHYARIAKDVAAGAVLAAAVVSALAGLVLFGKPQRLWETLLFFCTNPIPGITLLLLILLSVLFIFKGTWAGAYPGKKEVDPLISARENKGDRS